MFCFLLFSFPKKFSKTFEFILQTRVIVSSIAVDIKGVKGIFYALVEKKKKTYVYSRWQEQHFEGKKMNNSGKRVGNRSAG